MMIRFEKFAYLAQLSLSHLVIALILSIFIEMPLVSSLAHANYNLELSTDSSNDQEHLTVKQLLSQHKWEESIIILDGLIKREPKSIPNLIQMATALLYKGQRKEALELLIFSAQQMTGAAKAVLIRRIKIFSRTFITNKSFQVHQDGVNLLFSNKYKSAQEKFEKALSEEPDNVEALIRLGQTKVLGEEYEAAEKYLALAKNLNPFEPEIRLWLGKTYTMNGKMPEALSELQIAYNAQTGSELAPLWLSDALFNAGQGTYASRILESDLKSSPGHIFSLVRLSRFKVQALGSDQSTLEIVKKDLQSSMRRVSDYPSSELVRPEGELGLVLPKPPAQMKSQIEKLLQQVNSRLRDRSS